jgi:hypothetical protein
MLSPSLATAAAAGILTATASSPLAAYVGASCAACCPTIESILTAAATGHNDAIVER